ncbi:MAG: adenylate/guanylate cyclase domain-containing protein [Armatimonadetes bacterium]|nr:adenylate/guanylate cyclase domain-containing protein [Armatimonadota bacterium]
MSEVVAASEPTLTATSSRMDEFSSHVRENPSCLAEDPVALAEKFGLPIEFVRGVIGAMRAPVEQQSFVDVAFTAVRTGVSSLGRTVQSTIHELTARPLLCLLGSTGIVALVLFGLILLSRTFNISASFLGTGAAAALIGAVMVAATMLHAVCFYRHGMMRYALIVSAVVFFGFVAAFSALSASGALSDVERSGTPILPTIILASTLLTMLYFSFSAACSLLGGFARVREQSLAHAQVDRQAMLDRLFEVESRLNYLVAEGRTAPKLSLIRRIRASRTFVFNAFAFGIAMGLVELVLIGTIRQMGDAAGRTAPLEIMLSLGVLLLKTACYLGVGFLAGRPGRAISAIIATWAGHLIPLMIPFGGYGWPYVSRELSIVNLFPALLAGLLMGVLSGYAALIEDASAKQRRNNEEDPASLMAERIQLQWRLGIGQNATTVMVVDVARSTAMKAQADPLRVEWSFREYQQLVAVLSARHGGQVLSTAGDGAVVGFGLPAAATQAAREIQSEIARFNSRRNRLDTAFRLRIGIHAGHTQSNLADAPFNELIDIAAHIEGVAPVGGIAVSGEVAKGLEGQVELAEMARPVDGQPVFVVLNPTLEGAIV